MNGRAPRSGLLVLDKPAGPTSFDVVREARRALGIRKIGHAGTLDPFATGVLLLAFGPATRLLRFLSGGEKIYHLVVRFGVGTDSHDSTGEVTVEAEPNFSREDLLACLPAFTGEILQRPPSLSALHIDGERAYDRHRRGETDDLPPRPARIHSIDCLAVEGSDVTLRVRCAGGTYMRALARDLGERLACPAHAAALRREAVGPFTMEEAVPVGSLSEAWPDCALAPVELTRSWPRIRLSADDVVRTRQGGQPHAAWFDPLDLADANTIALLNEAGDLVAVAELVDDDIRLAMVLAEEAHAGP